MTHVQSCLKAFLLDEPIIRTPFMGKRPLIESGCHQGLITPEVDECADPEWIDQLPSPYWSVRWHRIRVSPNGWS